ncbi:phospholipase effector Tle1 domain-containing protein [Flavobacterium humidisoli]|jgi:hypothetical protein|uniref:DUF2235 domain-containing protein n=1 Tax=Flavobacterium humidisoli TaxID=2937442 RepID=A0ABY4LMF6_9FLAO|nr:DUF2235 domain-containing protein [Flavobacterium humidisoli]UPZ14285.1 DUF2235 domain-containing protein [Flavobacterium humidisoli]
MSKITIVQGDIIEFTGGNNIFYGREGIENSAERIIQGGKENGVTHGIPTTYETIENLKGVKITAILFFDGTKNNRNNTFRRLDKDANSNTSKDSKVIYKKNIEKESSYENGYSNIAALSYMAIDNPKERIVIDYIEGEGTENDQKGDAMGFAFGSGDTGISKKVKKGFTNIKTKIDGAFKEDKEYVKELIIKVFGFSRGAAAARSFLTTTEKTFKKNYPKAKITYAFAGLFDTVSSYEPEGYFGKFGSAASHNFDNDVKELGLKLDGMVKKVIHLTAENEYRKNFSLTTIASSIAAGVGFEFQIPGAHSDVGGGYEEYEHLEKRVIRPYYKKKQDWINEGWYTERQIKSAGQTYIGTRELKNSYQFIPLAIMMYFAKKNGVKFEGFDTSKQNKDFEVIPELENVKNKLLNLAIEKEGAISLKTKLNNIHELKYIRNHYLHISANDDSLGMDTNRPDGPTTMKRTIIEDNA